EPGASELQNLCAQIVDVQNAGHADVARECVIPCIYVGAKSKRQQLVLRSEIGLLQTVDVLRIPAAWALAPVISVNRPNARILKSLNAGVTVLRSVRNLRNVYDRCGPHVDETERCH